MMIFGWQDDNQGTTSQSTVPLPVRSLPTLGGQRSAVLPSLTETIKLLHRAVQDRPQRRVQVRHCDTHQRDLC